jgi:hypothetical protein
MKPQTLKTRTLKTRKLKTSISLLLFFSFLVSCTAVPTPLEQPLDNTRPPRETELTMMETEPPGETEASPETPLPPVPTVDSNLINDSLPPCEVHDPNVWHALVSADGTCHYDHEHKHDPTEGCALATFGEPGAWFGGSQISYPWETSDENHHKHEAYSYLVRCDIPDRERTAWIHAARVQTHADMLPFLLPDGTWAGGFLGRQHSSSVEAEVCTATECGIIRFGGWFNFGDLEVRKGDELLTQCAVLPDLSPDCPHGTGGRRIHYDNPGFPPKIPERGGSFFWYGEPSPTIEEGTAEVLNPVILAIATHDSMADVTLDNLFTPDQAMFCPAMDCSLNGSTLSLHVLKFAISARFDPDGDGFADFNGYTDRYGRLIEGCRTPGLDCVPLIIQHVPVGEYQFRDDTDLGLGAQGARDFDLSPAFLGTGSAWWITWPVRMKEMNMP